MTDIKGIIEIAVIAASLIGTVVYMKFGTRTPPGWEKDKLVKILFILEALCLVLAVKETFLAGDDPTFVSRNEAGDGTLIQHRILNVEGMVEDYDMELYIPERVLTAEERDRVFASAISEIDETFIWENTSIDNIETDVVMNESLADGLVSAKWQLESYAYISTSGKVKNEDLTEPVFDKAKVFLSCGDASDDCEERVYEFSFRIVPKTLTPLERFIAGVRDVAYGNLKKSETELIGQLPASYDGNPLVWDYKKKTDGILVFGIGIFVVLGLGIGRIAEARKKEEQRRQRLTLQYSGILSVLSLLLGAGMSVRKAWEKMVQNYFARNGPMVDAYEEMAITLRQMQDGTSEVKAIEAFGKRCGLACYRKLSGILVTYMQKGSRGITDQLSNEVAMAFEERKTLAKVAGEQAGTKLLLPMVMLLSVTLVIIIVPALMSFSF